MANSRKAKAAARTALRMYSLSYDESESVTTTDLITDLLLNLPPTEAETALRTASQDYYEDRQEPETD